MEGSEQDDIEDEEDSVEDDDGESHVDFAEPLPCTRLLLSHTA